VVFTVSALTAEEDRVAAVVGCSAQLEGDRRYDNLYHFLIQLSGGLITKLWEYGDTLHADKTFRG
jgi:ketosteroid isomerase-like protein